MGRIAEIFTSISETIEYNGYSSVNDLTQKDIDEIASEFNINYSYLIEILLDYANDPDPGYMDGDHESALASAGWGTDEDYNYYGA